jgi:hypothetical protein
VSTYYNSGAPGAWPDPAVSPAQEWNFVGNGVAVDFTLSGMTTTAAALYVVTLDGVVQSSTSDYSLSTTASKLTFVTAPPNGSVGSVRCFGYGRVVSMTDSSLVTATGSTTPRTTSNRAADVVNVKDFGALGNGVADDTAAIQAAINYAQVSPRGACVLLPRGTYNITGLTIANPGHLTIKGVHQTWFDGGTKLQYTGTGNAISINAAAGSPAYRVRLQDFGIWFSSATANAGVYVQNLSEIYIDNIGINGNWSIQTVANGFDIDGAGITYFTQCIVQQVTTAFNIRGYSTSQISGLSINKCNLFWCNVMVRAGLATYLHFYDNWVEAFQSGILIDSNYDNGPQMHLDVRDNFWQQSWGATTTTVPWASSANARILSITSTNNSKPIRVRGSFVNNTAYMSIPSTTAGPATYANSIVLAGNASTKDIQVSFRWNRFYGILTAGVYADTTDPILHVLGNEVTTDFWGGSVLPEVSGASLVNRWDVTAEARFFAQAAAKVPVVVRGAVAQSANLQEWQNSAGANLAYVSSAGTLNGGDMAFTNAYCSFFQAPGGNSAIIYGNAANGATAVGAYIGPQSAYTTDGAKLLSIRSSTTEKAHINALGGLSLGAPTAAWTANAMYSGSGAPNNSYGANGDFYFRTDGGAGTTIYHKRTGTWTGVV